MTRIGIDTITHAFRQCVAFARHMRVRSDERQPISLHIRVVDLAFLGKHRRIEENPRGETMATRDWTRTAFERRDRRSKTARRREDTYDRRCNRRRGTRAAHRYETDPESWWEDGESYVTGMGSKLLYLPWPRYCGHIRRFFRKHAGKPLDRIISMALRRIRGKSTAAAALRDTLLRRLDYFSDDDDTGLWFLPTTAYWIDQYGILRRRPQNILEQSDSADHLPPQHKRKKYDMRDPFHKIPKKT